MTNTTSVLRRPPNHVILNGSSYQTSADGLLFDFVCTGTTSKQRVPNLGYCMPKETRCTKPFM